MSNVVIFLIVSANIFNYDAHICKMLVYVKKILLKHPMLKIFSWQHKMFRMDGGAKKHPVCLLQNFSMCHGKYPLGFCHRLSSLVECKLCTEPTQRSTATWCEIIRDSSHIDHLQQRSNRTLCNVR